MDGAVGEARKHVCEVSTDGYAESAATLDDGEDGGYFWAGLFAAQVQPVLTADGDRPHRVLGERDKGTAYLSPEIAAMDMLCLYLSGRPERSP